MSGSRYYIDKSFNYHPILKTKYVHLHHIKQESDWDCGLACIKMLLPASKLAHFYDSVVEQDEGISSHRLWTIDLAYILKKFDIPFRYYTATIGISPELYKHDYYKNTIELDRDRLYKRFKQAEKNEIPVVKEVLSMVQIVRHLSDYGPMVILVNAKCLSCTRCIKNKYLNVNFHGHYIVVVGYNIARNYIFYLDPSASHGPCNMSLFDLENARNGSGTDHDTILIFEDNALTNNAETVQN